MVPPGSECCNKKLLMQPFGRWQHGDEFANGTPAVASRVASVRQDPNLAASDVHLWVGDG